MYSKLDSGFHSWELPCPLLFQTPPTFSPQSSLQIHLRFHLATGHGRYQRSRLKIGQMISSRTKRGRRRNPPKTNRKYPRTRGSCLRKRNLRIRRKIKRRSTRPGAFGYVLGCLPRTFAAADRLHRLLGCQNLPSPPQTVRTVDRTPPLSRHLPLYILVQALLLPCSSPNIWNLYMTGLFPQHLFTNSQWSMTAVGDL